MTDVWHQASIDGIWTSSFDLVFIVSCTFILLLKSIHGIRTSSFDVFTIAISPLTMLFPKTLFLSTYLCTYQIHANTMPWTVVGYLAVMALSKMANEEILSPALAHNKVLSRRCCSVFVVVCFNANIVALIVTGVPQILSNGAFIPIRNLILCKISSCCGCKRQSWNSGDNRELFESPSRVQTSYSLSQRNKSKVPRQWQSAALRPHRETIPGGHGDKIASRSTSSQSRERWFDSLSGVASKHSFTLWNAHKKALIYFEDSLIDTLVWQQNFLILFQTSAEVRQVSSTSSIRCWNSAERREVT